MKKNILLIISLLVLTTLSAKRQYVLLNNDWKFSFSHNMQLGKHQKVNLPHTWNAQDALSAKVNYKRGIGNYTKKLFIHNEWKGKRLFIRFEGANTITNLFINGKHVGEHRGGYTSFIFEITNFIKYGSENTLWVRVNNAEQFDVMPLVGDFNIYGGIYRDVHLLITDSVCISPLDFASSGIYLTQKSISKEKAEISTKIILSNATKKIKNITLELCIKDKEKIIHKQNVTVEIPKQTDTTEIIDFSISKPRLWNGKKDPFMYQVEISLYDANQKIDYVKQPLGIRSYYIDANKGFFLNGEHLQLRGVCRHQDRAEIGNALHSVHHQEDMDIMLEMGINALRLAHYPQAKEMYNLADQYGIITWAEIPFVGPGGYKDKGFIDLVSFKENGRMQLKEMIRQNYNHPSIFFWGLFNELKEDGDNPIEYIKELNELSKAEDPTRQTTSASNQDGALNFITDLIAWNKYDGWYGGMPKNLGIWLDQTHSSYPRLKIGISEYGAGASIYHQQDTLAKTIPESYWHPENWQTFYHIENWKIFTERPFIWGTFIWNMFDFGASHRTEGDRPGINDKGLVTFDRKVKKDSFYFYKANWNTEPMLYLSEKRNVNRTKRLQSFHVFTNLQEVELWVNGKSMGKKKPNSLCIASWNNIELIKGQNTIKAISADSKKTKISDESIINRL